MTVTVNCVACGQSFQMDVDEEGWRLGVIQKLVRVLRCNRCADLIESKKRSEHYAQKQIAKGPTEPF